MCENEFLSGGYSMQKRFFKFALFLAAILILQTSAAWAGNAGGGLPWEAPLQKVADSLTGPVALAVSLIALMVAGGTLVFGGELSEFARRSCVAVLAIAFLVLGAGFMTQLFGVAGATVL
jgi:type IV secretion system protein VirB2